MSLSIRVSHQFEGFRLQANFEAPGGVTAIFGRSGAGKSTLINAVAGLLHPDTGRIVVEDTVLLDTDQKISLATHRRKIGYVFQDGRLFPHMSVQQN